MAAMPTTAQLGGTTRLQGAQTEEQTMETLTKLDCGHDPTVHIAGGVATGKAYDRLTGASMCYACADAQQLEIIAEAAPGARVVGYMSNDGHYITTWSSGALMHSVRWGRRHNWSSERNYITATDYQGRIWSGTGARGMWASLKLTKRTR